MIVKNNLTNQIVYNQSQSVFKLYHTLPASILTNGISYNAQLLVQDKDGNESELSNNIVFYCYTSPIFNFTNIEENTIIQQSYLNLLLSYTQIEGELLNTYQIYLYDSTKKEVFKTGILYQGEYLGSNISGLRDGYQYFVRAEGKTVNGMDLDTGYITISVKYITPMLYSILFLDNNCKDATIRIKSNIHVITGVSNPNPPTYIDEKKIDLTSSDSWVKFNEGFGIEKDFTIELVGSNFKKYSEIVNISNGVNSIRILYMIGSFTNNQLKQSYFRLFVNNKMINYITTSNLIETPSDNQDIKILVRRINNCYQVRAALLYK